MFKTVIWATDGSEGADIALQEALHLAKLSGGRVVAVHCDHRLQGRAAGYPALADEEDRRIKLRRQVDELKADGIDIELVIRRSHREATDIVASVTAELGGDVIVCGTRGFGPFAGAVLGSFTQRLLHVAPCSVLAVRGRDEVEPEQVKDEEKAEAGA
jgi:nucleotide-binding universal stress UspA family protein